MKRIALGYMHISDGKWEDLSYEPGDEKLDPDEIILKMRKISIIYKYPLSVKIMIDHRTLNPNGFTRRKLSEQIMKQYRLIYDDAENGTASYMIWGHGIGDLMLHSLYIDNNEYTLGIDS